MEEDPSSWFSLNTTELNFAAGNNLAILRVTNTSSSKVRTFTLKVTNRLMKILNEKEILKAELPISNPYRLGPGSTEEIQFRLLIGNAARLASVKVHVEWGNIYKMDVQKVVTFALEPKQTILTEKILLEYLEVPLILRQMSQTCKAHNHSIMVAAGLMFVLGLVTSRICW